MTASALTLIKYTTGFLSKPNKVKIKVLFTQEIMGDGTWPRQGSASRSITSVHIVTYNRAPPAQRSDTGEIRTTVSLTGLSVQCTATITFATPLWVHKTIPQQIKNLVRVAGWSFFAFFFFFSIALNFYMVVNFIPVHLSMFGFTYPCLFLILITVCLLFSLLFRLIFSVISFFISVIASFYVTAKTWQYKFLLPEEGCTFRG